MASDVMDKCYKMVGAFFSRVTSSHSRRRDANNPQVVDVIRAVPHNGVPTGKDTATGAYKAGVWVWDVPHAGTSPRAQRPNHADGGTGYTEQRKCHSMERGGPPDSPQLKRQPDADSVTPASTPPVLDNDVKHASLLREPHPAHRSCEQRDRYMTLPHVTSQPRRGSRHRLSTMTQHPSTEGSDMTPPPHGGRKCKEEEVRRLAKRMVNSIETLIGDLHGIVGDLRQLVQHIDTVTDSIDISCGSGHGQSHFDNKALSEHRVAVTSANSCTQTDPDQQCHASSGHRDYVRRGDHVQKSPSHRYSYPQYCHSPVSVASSPSGFDTDRGAYRQSTSSSRKSRDGGRAVRMAVKSSSPPQQIPRVHSEVAQSHCVKFRPADTSRAQQRPRAFSDASFEHSLGPSLVPATCGHSPEPSMPFILVESPPNPAPTLFSAYREDNPALVKDSDSLPDRGLKTWKEKMEHHGGSADSLTPQMDWSYLVLTDHPLSAALLEESTAPRTNDRKQFRINRSYDPLSPQKDLHRLKFGTHSPEARRAQKDRSRLSQAAVRVKRHAGAITRIPEHGEPCDSSYDENCDVFTFVETCSSVSSVRTSAMSVSQAVTPSVGVGQQGQSVDRGLQNACSAPQDAKCTGALPRAQQSIGGASLGWTTHSKALPHWPSEELSSIGASDSDLDELSSPFLQQHFQYPRRSSALDSSSEKNNAEAIPELNRTSSVPDTICSGGFEVRPEQEISPESDVQSVYTSQYEKAMESRLEQLTNEVEVSDFSDVDADAGSDVLEQSLTSLEDTPGARYDRELNTWTSYTMTHIDSDDVVSECTSDILNENLAEMATTNPGFDDVSLNFDDIGFLPLPLQGNAIGAVSPSLE
ncbi:uncharacterized protein LOC143282119 [Babylonia areolata]|uniref:uncharacterized protein LOC143282119 n=1 Tax=Babylonia areolata TaxID=304850 RepID=UPI003FD2C74F